MHGSSLSAWVERARSIAERAPGLDQFELRAGQRESIRYVLRDGRLTRATRSASAGIGVRAYHGRASAFAYTDEVGEASIASAIERAADLARANAERPWEAFEPHVTFQDQLAYAPDVRIDPHEASDEEIVELLTRAEQGLNGAGVGHGQGTATLGSLRETTILATSAGGWAQTTSLLSTLLCQALSREAGRTGEGVSWRGGERGLGDYEDRGGPEALGRATAEQAEASRTAINVPAGRHRVLCDNELTGLLCHEAFGHLTEYDLVAPGWSVLKGRLGERLAPESITVRDVPVVQGAARQGVAVPYDAEGTRGRAVTLLQGGVLSEFMHVRDSSPHEGVAPTGNARAISVRHEPIVRMRNTILEPGDLDVEEAVEAVGDGLYLVGARGGVPRPDGSFLFTAQRGWVVEKGECTRPVRMATIHGNVFDFLGNVEGLTNDLEVHTNYFGGCGKWNQSYLHVGTGGPHVLVSQALVGGQGT